MTQDEVRALFAYEPETGMLRRIDGKGRKPYPWRCAGRGGRYLAFTHRSRTYYLHQLVWLYHYGVIPPMVDHRKDDLPLDNRIANLRACTNSQNQFNSRRKVNNRSGVKGVVYHAKCTGKPWHAQINLNGRRISLGYHATLEAATAAYSVGAARVAGEFARKD